MSSYEYKNATPPLIPGSEWLKVSRIGNIRTYGTRIKLGTQIDVLDPPGIGTDAVNKDYCDSNRGTPSIPDSSIQFNNSGSFGGSPDLTWSGTSLNVTNADVSGTLTLNNAPTNSTDAANKAYVDSVSGGSPGLPSNSLQYNDNGTFAGTSDLTWNNATKFLTVNGTVTLPNLPINNTDAANKAYVDAATGSSPGGPAQAVQFNSDPSGIFTGSSDFSWDNVNKILSVNGNVVASQFLTSSTVLFKKNISPLEDPIEKINRIGGYSYNLKGDDSKTYGVLAEELEDRGLGELVTEVGGYKRVDYTQMIPLLVEGFKILSNENEKLRSDVLDLDSKNKRITRAERKKRRSRENFRI